MKKQNERAAMRNFVTIVISFVFLWIAALLIGCETKVEYSQKPTEAVKSVYQQGRRAARLGLPVEANPWRNNSSNFYYQDHAANWLEGYLDEKEGIAKEGEI